MVVFFGLSVATIASEFISGTIAGVGLATSIYAVKNSTKERERS